MFLREMTINVRDQVARSIPGGTFALNAYRNGLKTAVISEGKRVAITAVFGFAPVGLSNADARTTLYYFSRETGSVDDPAGAILAAFDPWVLDQLPPVKVGSPVTMRKVTPAEVEAIRKLNAPQLEIVNKYLKQARIPFGDRVQLREGSLFDLENLAMRMEYGLPGVPHVPHWRPNLVLNKARVLRQMEGNRTFTKSMQQALNNPRYRGHQRRLAKGMDVRARKSDLKKIKGFVKRVTK